MKKLLSLLLSAILLLSACAFAEEAAPVTQSHRLSNVYMLFGDQIIDLSNFYVEVDVSGDEKADAWRLHVNSKDGTVSGMNMSMDGGNINVDASAVEEKVQLSSPDGTVAEIGLTRVDGKYIVHLYSESLGHVDYAIDPVTLLAKIMDQGIAGIVSILQSLDTTDMARGIVNAIDSIGSQPASEPVEVPEEPVEAVQLPSFSIEGDLTTVLTECLGEPRTEQMGGVDYAPDGSEIIIADGTYTTQEFTFDNETVSSILNMVYINGEPSGLGDKLRETGVTFSISGSVQKGEEEGLNEITTVNGTMNAGGMEYTLNISADTFDAEDGRTTVFSYGITQGNLGFALSFRLTDCQHEGEAFTPGSVDLDDAILLTDMDLDEAFSTLGAAIGTVSMESVSALLSPVMEMLKASVDVDALRAQAEAAAAEMPAE